jgi:predicted metal-binding membrane protein
MTDGLTLEAVVKRDRAIVLAGVAGLSALAWAYLLVLAWREPHQHMAMAMAMPHMHAWGASEVLLA